MDKTEETLKKQIEELKEENVRLRKQLVKTINIDEISSHLTRFAEAHKLPKSFSNDSRVLIDFLNLLEMSLVSEFNPVIEE